jgi:hypothetical protein
MYLRICVSFKSAKIIWSANRKSANRKKYKVRKSENCHISGGSAKQNKIIRKFADLRIAELICGPPTFANE